MNESKKIPEFRFYYSTNRYEETISFYKNSLQLKEMNSWDRGYCNKGTVFQSPNGSGLIEIEEGTESPVLQGSLYIEVEDVDVLYDFVIAKKIEVVQPLTNMSYGHRSFKIKDPNNLVIGFFKYSED